MAVEVPKRSPPIFTDEDFTFSRNFHEEVFTRYRLWRREVTPRISKSNWSLGLTFLRLKSIIHRQICNFMVIPCFLEILGMFKFVGKGQNIRPNVVKIEIFKFFKISPNMLKMTKCTCFLSFSSK